MPGLEKSLGMVFKAIITRSDAIKAQTEVMSGVKISEKNQLLIKRLEKSWTSREKLQEIPGVKILPRYRKLLL